jgi:hypothetical protein
MARYFSDYNEHGFDEDDDLEFSNLFGDVNDSHDQNDTAQSHSSAKAIPEEMSYNKTTSTEESN